MFRHTQVKKPQVQEIPFNRLSDTDEHISFDSSLTLKLYESTNINRIQQTVCVCILVKQIDTYLNAFLTNLSFIQSAFNKSFIVFVAHKTENSEILSKLENLDNSLLIKTDIVQEYEQRNLYLKFVQSNKVLFNFMMVIDPKISLSLPLNQSIFNFITTDDFNVAFSNQTYKYYDIENLVDNLKQVYTIQDKELKKTKIKQYQKHIPKHSDLISVQSAFGGFAIYNTSVLDSDNKYATDNHITFNLKISKKYSKMFIVPSFIIETSPNNASLYVK